MRFNLFTTSFVLLSALSVLASAQQSQPVNFETSDKLKIVATWQAPSKHDANAKSAAIIFIHQGGSSRSEWTKSSLWKKLAESGYGLLAYDIRLHGDSGKDDGNMMDLFNNPDRAPNDLKAALLYLRKQDSIAPDRIAIIGASIGGNLACVASADEAYKIKSAVSMSAKTSAAQNLSGSDEPIQLRNVFHIASEKEQGGMRMKWAKELFEKTKGHRRVSIAKGNKHGSYILADDTDIENEIIAWLKKTL